MFSLFFCCFVQVICQTRTYFLCLVNILSHFFQSCKQVFLHFQILLSVLCTVSLLFLLPLFPFSRIESVRIAGPYSCTAEHMGIVGIPDLLQLTFSDALILFPQCSRINRKSNFIAQDFFQKIWDFTGNFWKNSKFVHIKNFSLNFMY